MITQLTPETLANPAVLEMGGLFFKEARLPGSFVAEKFVSAWSQIMSMDFGTVWIATTPEEVVGTMGVLIHPDMYDGKLVAQEAFWFMHPNHRTGMHAVRLYYAFEAWAKERGAERISMSNTFNGSVEKTRKFYMKLGYRAVDVSYFKDL